MGQHKSRMKWAALWEQRNKKRFGRRYFEAREREVQASAELQAVWRARLKGRHEAVTNTKGAPWLEGSMTARKVAKAVFWDLNPVVRSVTTTVQVVKMAAKHSGATAAAEKAAEKAKLHADSRMNAKQKKRLSDAAEAAEAQRLKLRGVKYEDVVLAGPEVPPMSDECRAAVEGAFEGAKERVERFARRIQGSQARVAGLKIKLAVLLLQIRIRDEKMKMGLGVYAAMKRRNLDEVGSYSLQSE